MCAGGIFPTSLSDVMTQRAQLRDIIYSSWPACTAPDPEHKDVPFRVGASIASVSRLAAMPCHRLTQCQAGSPA